MELKIYKLLEKLAQYEIAANFYRNKEAVIHAAQILAPGVGGYDPKTLYISRVSEIFKYLPAEGLENVLCVEDGPISDYEIYPYAMNWFIVGPDCELPRLQAHIQEVLDYEGKLETYLARFLNALLEGRSIHEFIEIGFEMLGNPIFVTDPLNNVLTYTKDVEVDDPDWHEIVEKGYVSYNVAMNSEIKKQQEQASLSKKPVISDSKKDHIPVMRTTIIYEEKVIGHLVIPGNFKPFTEMDLESAALLSNILSLVMQHDKFNYRSRGVMVEYFIGSLLEGRTKSPSMIREEMKIMKLEMRENLYILVIRAKNHYTSNVSPIQVMEAVKQAIPCSIAVLFEDDIVILINSDTKISKMESAWEDVVNMLNQKGLHAGVSNCFDSIIDIQEHYCQAVKAIELGFKVDKKMVIYPYERYAIYHIIDVCDKNTSLISFCHPAILKLEQYDLHNGTELTKSLLTYLIHNKNLIETGNTLHLHRNTMSYRIKKIEEIVDVNLDDGELTFYLLMSFKIRQYAAEAGGEG